jgi:hypothetical protein
VCMHVSCECTKNVYVCEKCMHACMCVCVCMCVCMYVCMCVCVCMGTPTDEFTT